MFVLPLLMLASGFHFAGIRKYSWRMPLMTGLVYVLVVGLSLLQPRLLEKPYRQVSNAAGQLYQIHTNAPSWSVYLSLPFPDTLNTLADIADAKSRFVSNEIRKEPMRFFRNYLYIIMRAIPRPETWIFSFAYHLPNWFKWGFLIFFLLTPCIRNRKDPLQALFLLLCLNLIGSLLSIPFMEEIRTRLMMVTMPMHIMVVVLGLTNVLYLFSGSFRSALKPSVGRGMIGGTQSCQGQKKTVGVSLLIALIFFAPVMFDQIRKIEKPTFPNGLMRIFRQYNKILIDLNYTPKAHFDLDREFKVTDPYIIPRSKLLSNMPDTTSSLQERFYLANAVSCVGKPNRRMEASLLVIPDSLMIRRSEPTSRFMLLRIRESGFQGIMNGSYIADSVLWAK